MIVDFKLILESTETSLETGVRDLINRGEGWEPQGSMIILTVKDYSNTFYMPMVKIEPEIIYREAIDDVGTKKL